MGQLGHPGEGRQICSTRATPVWTSDPDGLTGLEISRNLLLIRMIGISESGWLRTLYLANLPCRPSLGLDIPLMAHVERQSAIDPTCNSSSTRLGSLVRGFSQMSLHLQTADILSSASPRFQFRTNLLR